MKKIIAPKPEYLQNNGESHMRWSLKQAQGLYDFLESLASNYNELITTDEDPETSSLSYMDYTIKKLGSCQHYLLIGTSLYIHIAPDKIEDFKIRLVQETRWRIANGAVTSQDSWLRKGGVNSLPDARGVVLRGWTDNSNTDPDGWNRPLGAFQDYAMKNHKHNTSVNYSTPTVSSNFPDFHVMRHLDGSINIQTINTFDTNLSDHELRMKNISSICIILT